MQGFSKLLLMTCCKQTTAGQLCTVGCLSSALLTMHVLVSLNDTVMTADAHAMQV